MFNIKIGGLSMAIKKLQNNFTDPEQSKRLLELGIPEDSADCSIDEWGRVHKIPQDNGNLLFSKLKRRTIYTIRPCWSVGRLIEICNICSIPKIKEAGFHLLAQDFDDLIETMIISIKMKVEHEWMDFSKLEE